MAAVVWRGLPADVRAVEHGVEGIGLVAPVVALQQRNPAALAEAPGANEEGVAMSLKLVQKARLVDVQGTLLANALEVGTAVGNGWVVQRRGRFGGVVHGGAPTGASCAASLRARWASTEVGNGRGSRGAMHHKTVDGNRLAAGQLPLERDHIIELQIVVWIQRHPKVKGVAPSAPRTGAIRLSKGLVQFGKASHNTTAAATVQRVAGAAGAARRPESHSPKSTCRVRSDHAARSSLDRAPRVPARCRRSRSIDDPHGDQAAPRTGRRQLDGHGLAEVGVGGRRCANSGARTRAIVRRRPLTRSCGERSRPADHRRFCRRRSSGIRGARSTSRRPSRLATWRSFR